MSSTPEDEQARAALVTESPLETPVATVAVPATSTGLGVAKLWSAAGFQLSAAMFLHHFAVGVWFVTLGSYVNANSGDSGSRMFAAGFVGIAYSAGPLGGMISPFLTGLLADHFFAAERIMAVLSLVCAAALWGAMKAATQSAFFVAMVIYFLCYYPSFSLTTSMTLHHLKSPERHFPIVRAWGTTGWVAAGLFVGWFWPLLTGRPVEASSTPMLFGLVAELLMAALCLWLPHTPPANKSRQPLESSAQSRWQLGGLVRNPRFRALLLIAVLAHIPSQFYYVYSNVYFNWTGMEFAAAKMALGQVVEVGCMLLLPAVLAAVSVKSAIVVGLSIWAARFLMLSIAAAPDEPARNLLLYAAIMLHGVAFTLVTISLQLDVDRCAGTGRRATAQGLFTVAVQGLGCFVGAQLAGAAGARWLNTGSSVGSGDGWGFFWVLPCLAGVFVAALTVAVLPQQDATR